MDQFLNFASNALAANVEAQGGDFQRMFGVAPADPSAWLAEKGGEVGREVMGKLMHAMYAEHGLEPPVDAIVARSLNPADMVLNSGLGGGALSNILAPIVAGVVSAIQQSGVKDKIMEFATQKAATFVGQHAEAIARQGERLGEVVVDGIARALDAQADEAAVGREVPEEPEASAAPDALGMQEAAMQALDRSGVDGAPPGLLQAVVSPITRGLTNAVSRSETLQRVVEKVLGAAPLARVREAVLGALYPVYQRACNAVEPQLQRFGGVAGDKIIQFLSAVDEGARDVTSLSRQAMVDDLLREDAVVERDLVSPVLTPFMLGLLQRLGQSGWKSKVMVAFFRRMATKLNSCVKKRSG